MARIIDVKITTASSARLGVFSSRGESNKMLMYFNQIEAKRKDEGDWVH